MLRETVPPLLLAILLIIPVASAGTVTRGFSNDTIIVSSLLTVTLAVDVNESEEDSYALEEQYPALWTVVDNGGLKGMQEGFLKITVIENAQDTQYSYVLRAPNSTGSHDWYGEYLFENMSQEEAILGPFQVTVVEGCPDYDGDGHHDISCGGDDPYDNDNTVYPGAPELCDGKDNDLDGSIDEGCEEDGNGGGGRGGTYTPPECVPDWQCSPWSRCLNGSQTRECLDLNECGTDEGRPATEQECVTGSALPDGCSEGETICLGDNVLQCDARGEWKGIGTCEHGCSGGACIREPGEGGPLTDILLDPLTGICILLVLALIVAYILLMRRGAKASGEMPGSETES
jgi:hypothetical protein